MCSSVGNREDTTFSWKKLPPPPGSDESANFRLTLESGIIAVAAAFFVWWLTDKSEKAVLNNQHRAEVKAELRSLSVAKILINEMEKSILYEKNNTFSKLISEISNNRKLHLKI